MKRSPCFECDVTGKVKEVKHYKVFVYETDEEGRCLSSGTEGTPLMLDSPLSEARALVAFESPKRDLCPDALHRLINFIKRGLCGPRIPPDQRGAMLAPPEPGT